MTEEKKKKKELTVKIMKEKRTVPKEVSDNLKKFTKIKKTIKSSLESESKIIPQIAKDIDLPVGTVTYYVMSLQKFGELETDDVNEDDYYLYKLSKNS